MRALSIDAQNKESKEIEIHLQANTVYTFFNSILIDELSCINEHIVYTDAEALEKNKEAYFIGEQLVIGDALILGRDSFEDLEASIPLNEISSLVKHELNAFYSQVIDLLRSSEMNLYRSFEIDVAGEKLQLNPEWVLYTFNLADDKTKQYFIDELKKVVEQKSSSLDYIKRMATLAIRSGATA